MLANHCVGLHNYQRFSPVLPDMGKQNPKPLVALCQSRPFVYALEDRSVRRQLLLRIDDNYFSLSTTITF